MDRLTAGRFPSRTSEGYSRRKFETKINPPLSCQPCPPAIVTYAMRVAAAPSHEDSLKSFAHRVAKARCSAPWLIAAIMGKLRRLVVAEKEDFLSYAEPRHLER
jgi:hypothetical protein